MSRTGSYPKVETFNFRVDPELKAAFTAATTAEDKPAGQVLRELMRGYVERRRDRAVKAGAARYPQSIEMSKDDSDDDAEVMLWIADVSDTEGWTA